MPHLKDYFQLHFIVLIWGFTAILGLLITIPAVELVFYRTALAALLMAVVVRLRKQSFRLSYVAFAKIAATGVLIALHWILFFAAARVSTASVCLAGMATASLWTSLLEPLIHRQRIKPYEIALGITVMMGLYIVFLFEFNHILGLVLAVLSAFLGALFTVINSRFILKHNHHVITFYEMVGAFLGTCLILPFHQWIFAKDHSLHLLPTTMDWLYIGILAAICTVYAYTVGVKLMTKFSAFAINLTVNLEPVYGILLAFLIFGKSEKMTLGFYGGTLIILVAVLSYPYLSRYFTASNQEKSYA